MGQEAGILTSEIPVRSSGGATLPCYLAEPPGVARPAGVVIAPEIFGVSEWIRACARRLAEFGFRALAVEVFARDPLPQGEHAPMAALMARMQRLSWLGAVDDLRAGAALLRERGSAKIGSIGFCMGGTLSLLYSGDPIDAAVACYGRLQHPAEPLDAVRRGRCPVLGIYGSRDSSIPLDDVQALRRALASRSGSEVHVYDAGHAFLNDHRPEHHDSEQAALAWAKIEGFLLRNLEQ
ncbi:MAG TPA: dienelactone hydrolase family protein [Myxococcales bacterium]|nr:dienelactone hydrolase family protein [Myxococcales bacterium]